MRKYLVVIVMLFSLLWQVRAQNTETAAGNENDGVEADAKTSWPKKYDYKGGEIVLYQPQVDKWENQRLESRMAFAVKPPKQENPVYGALWFTCKSHTDMTERMVTLHDFKIEKITLPTKEGKEEQAKELIGNFLPKNPKNVPLDYLLENINRQQIERKQNVSLGDTLPRIFVAYKPTELLSIDGKVQLQKIKGTNLSYVYNTGWVILHDDKAKEYFTLVGNRWFKAKSLEGGKWEKANWVLMISTESLKPARYRK